MNPLILFTFFIFVHYSKYVVSLNNGLAIRPPLGWSSWLALPDINCIPDSVKCLSSSRILEIAKELEKSFVDVGYQYVIIDDGWQSSEREQLKLVADRHLFPEGIKDLAFQLQKMKLDLGLFSDLGFMTGRKKPGSAGLLEIDAQTFLDWDVRYVKMSAFTATPLMVESNYFKFGNALKNNDRKAVLYATSLPVFSKFSSYREAATISNTYRFAGDSLPDWDVILNIMDDYAEKQSQLTTAATFGAWHDADLLVIGHDNISLHQGTSQMIIWAIMASPLIFSCNIEQLNRPGVKEVLLNKNIIAVSQDELGIPGSRYKQVTHDGCLIDVWIRKISPIVNGKYTTAVAFVNRNTSTRIIYSTLLSDLNMTNVDGYYVTDLLVPDYVDTANTYRNTLMHPNDFLTMFINPSGVAFFKIQPTPPVSDEIRFLLSNNRAGRASSPFHVSPTQWFHPPQPQIVY